MFQSSCEGITVKSLDVDPSDSWLKVLGRKAGWYSPFLMVCRVMSGFSDAFYIELPLDNDTLDDVASSRLWRVCLVRWDGALIILHSFIRCSYYQNPVVLPLRF
ncbi:unnamed protein product [Eruca vesicaria subsp. sativa]|uniref:Uncharacterized protein n=1 Tax=Eruca vesicaria subsp. sativa TaxID=29727 RepID=A0ABC8JMX3_ERUVS|nr:unnamed protein product [Eruca vesicaria subsp. sativa]